MLSRCILIFFYAFIWCCTNLYFATITCGQTAEGYHLSSDSTVNSLAGMKKTCFAQKITQRPKIDGLLNDECWISGKWEGDFVQQVPNQGKLASEDTQFKILFDETNLYIGIKCKDQSSKGFRPILGRRDEYNGDMLGFAFDSYNDKQTAYEFDVGASGQKVDLVHLGPDRTDENWNAVWEAKVQIKDSIWTTEVRIPFSQLRFAPGAEQLWGLHVWRWIDRLNEESQWKLIPIDAPALVYLFGELRGLDGIEPKTNYEFLPYVNARYSPNSDVQNHSTFGFGLDGKIGLNSGFKLDYAINPDFGQVEADPSELNLTNYEVFYDEKRPFFLEGNTILDFSIDDDLLYYSRRIGHAPSYYPSLDNDQTLSIAESTPILSALKLTGKTKSGLSVGLIHSMTIKEDATIYNSRSSENIAVEPFTNFMIGSLKQDFNHGNTVLSGMVASTLRNIEDQHLEFLPHSALSGGIDFQHNWKKRKYFVDFKGFFSDINGDKEAISKLQLSPVHYYQRTDAEHLDFNPDLESLSGWGGQLKGGKRSGKLRVIGTLNWRSPGVDLNDLGYLYQADLIKQTMNFTYRVNEPKTHIRRYYVEFEQEHIWSFGGENTLDQLKLHGFAEFSNLWNTHLNMKRYFNIYDTRELRGGPNLYKDAYHDVELFIQSNSVKKLFVGFGPRLKFYSDNFSKSTIFTLYARWQINNRFSITSNSRIDYSIDHHQYIRSAKDTQNEINYLVGTIDRKTLYTTIRVEYFVTPEISLQYYGNPYASKGTYQNFRETADADNKSLVLQYNNLQSTLGAGNTYTLQKNGKTEYKISNPDFNFQEFRSNLVARWEFKPGSTLYFVWTNTRSAYYEQLDQSIWKSFGNIWTTEPENVFMIKLSYWFSL